MHWVLLDLLIYALAVLLLALVGYAVYRRVRVLLRAVGTASREVGSLTAGLNVNKAASREIR